MVIARLISTGLIGAGPIFTARLVAAGLISALLVRAGFAGAVVCTGVFTGTVVVAGAGVFAGAVIIARAVVVVATLLILAGFTGARIITTGIFTARLIAALLRANGFGQLYQTGLFITDNVKSAANRGIAIYIGLVAPALIATIVAAVIAIIAVARTIPIAILRVWILLISVRLTVVLAILLAAGLLTIPTTLRRILLILLAAFLLCRQFAVRFGQHAGVMLGMLREILGSNPVIRQLRIARQLLIFLDDLLRCAAHFAFGARAVEHTVGDVA